MVEMIALVNRLLAQKPKDKKKLYSLHEPAVDCISKGKAHKRYEFGTKVSVATTNRGGFVVGMRALPGNPYDGHTLSEALEQVEILTDQKPGVRLRRPRISRPWRRECEGFHQWREARCHQDDCKTPATAQRHRTDDRAHEKRRATDAKHSERNRRRCSFRRALRMRSQHPHDPQAPESHFAPTDRADPSDLYGHQRGNCTQSKRSSRQTGALKAIFRTDHLNCGWLFSLIVFITAEVSAAQTFASVIKESRTYWLEKVGANNPSRVMELIFFDKPSYTRQHTH